MLIAYARQGARMSVHVKARSRAVRRDLYAWSEAQAEPLRCRRFAKLDLEHVVDEIDDVGSGLRPWTRSHFSPPTARP